MTNNECLLHLDHAKGTLDSPLVAQRLQRNRELKLQRLQPEFEATFAEARRQQSAMEQTADAVREEQRRLERMSEVMRNMRERGKTQAAERADEIATLQVAMGEAYKAQEAVERELEEVRERNIEDQRRRENQVERLKSQIEKEMKRRAEVVAQAWDAYEEYVELCHTVQPATPPTVGTAASATIHSGPRHLSRSTGLNTSTASPARRRTSVAGGATPRPDLNTSSAGALADSTSISSARLIQDEEVQLQRELAALLEETATLRGACAVSRKRLESAGVDVSHLAPVDEPATGTPTGQTPMPGQTPAVTGRRRAGSRASDGSRVTVPGPSKPPRTGASTPLPRPVKPVTAKK
jgi:predicted  nucleic acid-binding Zn-ribbon protein